MRARLLALVSLSILCGCVGSALASDLVWEVENPFRLFKTPQAFALHEAAFKLARGDAGLPGEWLFDGDGDFVRAGLDFDDGLVIGGERRRYGDANRKREKNESYFPRVRRLMTASCG
jgi:hypothetical protein